jgi:hypothetical protein
MDRKRLEQELEEAERELDAARGRTALNDAARRLHRARAALKDFDSKTVRATQHPKSASF